MPPAQIRPVESQSTGRQVFNNFLWQRHFLQAEIIPGHPADQLMDLHNRLERLTSVIPCTPEGYMAINPRNIKRIELYPAPPEAVHSAWLVN